MRTIVFHHGALGDSVITWPMLRALARIGPVTLIAPRGKAQLAARYMNDVEPIDGDDPRWSRLFAGDDADDTVRRDLADASTIITFVSTGEDRWAESVRKIAPAAELIPLPTRPADADQPVAVIHARLLAERGVRYEPAPTPRRMNPDGPLVIHPGAGGEPKRWPVERFDELIEIATAARRAVRVIIGEVERERMDASVIDGWRDRAQLIEPSDYVGLAGAIEPAWAFVGNDSGPSHLADALGVRTLVLFGPTDSRVWRPIGAGVLEPMDRIQAGDAWSALNQNS